MSFVRLSNGLWVQDPTSVGAGGSRLDENFKILRAPRGLNRVHRFSEIEPFFDACCYRRADIALIGDSNTHVDNGGYGLSLPRSYGFRFGSYATGVHGTNATSNSTQDYRCSFGDGNPFDSIPMSHVGYGGIIPDSMYVASTFGGTWNHSFVQLDPLHPMAARALTWRFRYGTFSTGSGVFYPCCRYDSTLSYLANGGPISTNTGTDGMAEGTLSVAAGARAAAIWFTFQGVFDSDFGASSGPFYSNLDRIEFTDEVAGVSVSTLFFQGGVGTRIPAEVLQAMTQTQFNEWASAVTGPQNATPILLIQILEGQNDTGDTTLSVGPNPALSNTVPGSVDNHAAIVNRLRILWTGAGYDVDDLYFLLGPYHPQQWSRAQWGHDLDEALNDYVNTEQNIAVASRSRISSNERFVSQSRYLSAYPDDAHLSAQGHYDWADELVSVVVP